MDKNEIHKLTDQVKANLESFGYEFIEANFRLGDKNQLPSRIDLIVLDDERKPFIVVEVRANLPENISKFHPAVDQAYRYAIQANAPFFVVTNGIEFNWFKITKDADKVVSIKERPQYKKTRNIQLQDFQSDDITNYLFSVTDLLRGNVKSSDYPNYLFAILCAKIWDETVSLNEFRFRAYSGESAGETKARISKLYQDAIESQNLDFDKKTIEGLDEGLVQNIVKKIEHIRFRESNVFEYFVAQLGRMSKGYEQYYIPSNLNNFVSQLFEFAPEDTILDPALGAGSFLTSVAIHLGKHKEDAPPKLFGIERNMNAGFLAAIQLAALGALEKSRLIWGDFLSQDVQNNLHRLNNAGFDYVFCNPPFGIHAGRFLEADYIDAIINQLKPNGYAILVVPEGYLASSRHRERREFLISQVDILVVISLPVGTFYPVSGVKTSILIFRKKISKSLARKTLFLRIPEEKDIWDKSYSMAMETCKHFIKTNRLLKNTSISVSPVLMEISSENGHRMDYSAYASEYIHVIEQLSRIDAEIFSLGDIANVKLGYSKSPIIPDGLPIISASDLRNDGALSEKLSTIVDVSDTRECTSSEHLGHKGQFAKVINSGVD